jgi:hypothetical protein
VKKNQHLSAKLHGHHKVNTESCFPFLSIVTLAHEADLAALCSPCRRMPPGACSPRRLVLSLQMHAARSMLSPLPSALLARRALLGACSPCCLLLSPPGACHQKLARRRVVALHETGLHCQDSCVVSSRHRSSHTRTPSARTRVAGVLTPLGVHLPPPGRSRVSPQ